MEENKQSKDQLKNDQVKKLFDVSDELRDQFILILPENYNQLELIFCVQHMITYLYWNKYVHDNETVHSYYSKYLMEQGYKYELDMPPDVIEQMNNRHTQYRSASEDSITTLSALICLNLIKSEFGTTDIKILKFISTLVSENEGNYIDRIKSADRKLDKIIKKLEKEKSLFQKIKSYFKIN